ncbi:MAG: hypothetical protein LBI11_04115 [Streptococcaceae bacterium]|jgi:hypothetical protein|nr:hypothetical protein [Streptococcaceae bacterium]
MTTLKEKFLAQVDKYDAIYQGVFSIKAAANDKQAAMAQAFLAQDESPQKTLVMTNIERLIKLTHVEQFQTEAVSEYIRAFVGPVAGQFAQDAVEDEAVVPAFLFLHSRLMLLHDQLDFFFSNFIEEDLKNGFAAAKNSASELAYKEETQEDDVHTYLELLEIQSVDYVHYVARTHAWVHEMFEVLVAELTNRGLTDIPVPES